MAAKDTIERGLDAFNRHDSAAFAGNFTENAVAHDPFQPEPLRGRAAVQKDIQEFFDAFPDIRGEIIALLTTDDSYAADIMMSGTHKGPLAGPAGDIPATNKSVKVGIAILGRVDAGGQITEERRYLDTLGLMGQLGLMPGPGAAGGSADLPGSMLT